MRMSVFTLAFGSFLSVFVLALAGCSKGEDSANTIKVGHVASMQGDTATFGQSSDKGIRLAMDEINAAGGVLGKQIKVITEDDRSVSSEARTAANKLITKDAVVALLGEIASSRSIAMAPVAQKAMIPMVSPGSTNPTVTQEGDYVFRVCFIDPFQGEAMARFAMEKLGFKKFAILHASNSDYSAGLREFIKIAVAKGNGTIVAEESYSEKQDKDFKGQLTKIKSANPEAIFVPGYYQEAGLIAQQAKQLGLNVPLIGGDGWDSDVLLKTAGPAMEGNYFTNHYAPDEDRPEVKVFVDAFNKKYNEIPDAMAVLGYDAMHVLADAIKRAGNTDGKAIRDALAATKDLPAAAGKITINKERNADKPLVVVQIKDGKFTYSSTIKPSDASSDAPALPASQKSEPADAPAK